MKYYSALNLSGRTDYGSWIIIETTVFQGSVTSRIFSHCKNKQEAYDAVARMEQGKISR